MVTPTEIKINTLKQTYGDSGLVVNSTKLTFRGHVKNYPSYSR